MSDHRPQGRPCRGVSEVGKEKILLALRNLLRSNHCSDLSRKAVAAYAGVTPALISYYFPKKQQLLDEAVTPIVTAYADEICGVTASSASADVKTREIISILIRLYRHDGKILDLYRDNVEKPKGATDQTVRMTSALAQLFDPTWNDEQSTPQLDAAIFQGAIWGMCRFAANVEQVMALEGESRRQDGLCKRVAETLINIVSRAPNVGLSPGPVRLSFDPAAV